MLFSYVIKLPNILKWATKDLRAHISYKKCKFYLKRVFFVFKTSISFPILIPILIYEHLMVIGYLYTFVLAFNFPPTTHNIVVGPLLYVFFSLFYFLCKHYYRKKKKKVAVERDIQSDESDTYSQMTLCYWKMTTRFH